MSRKLKFLLNVTKLTDVLFSHLAQCFLELRVFQREVIDKIKIYFMFKKCFPKIDKLINSDNVENIVHPVRPQTITWRMRILCWI